MTRALALLFVLAAPALADDAVLKALKKDWPTLSRAAKTNGLMRLGAQPSPAVLTACKKWLADDDLFVRSQVVRLVALHEGKQAQKLLAAYAAQRLKERRAEQKREFAAVCKKHGTKLPPEDQIAAGSDWRDPWEEPRRTLPPATKAERAHMREVVGALQSAGVREPLLAIFREHHDPDVLVRTVEAFGALKMWTALPAMADLARIQKLGRGVGGSHVIGEKKWRTMRLKWDVHKDRLWWSRPEYVLRTVTPILAAARAITGAKMASVTQLDAWLLANEPTLKKQGVDLPRGFRQRAAISQR